MEQQDRDLQPRQETTPAQPERERKNFFVKLKGFSWRLPVIVLPLAFFLVERFAYVFLSSGMDSWPLVFGFFWALILSGFTWALPGKGGRIAFGILYYLAVIYAAVQTGYYILFNQMMWIADFRYASEGSKFFSVLLQYPVSWWLWLVGMLLLGGVILWLYPRHRGGWIASVVAVLIAAVGIVGVIVSPYRVFEESYDTEYKYSGSDYGRSASAEAAYENMFNAYRLYQICGIYHTAAKDIYTNYIFPLSPGYANAQKEAEAEIRGYFESRGETTENEMTGIFEGKNVVLVLMESMDDWALGEHTPTINRLMEEGICFTNFYTPMYGGVRTFNSEFCINTGSFLSTRGGYAFDYVTNHYSQSLASLLVKEGYTAKAYHYNEPEFYSRGEFIPAMGYGEYVSYMDYTREKTDLYDDEYLFKNEEISQDFFREGKTLNFIITRSAHLSYIYNEVVSHYGLSKYPQYRGMTGHQEKDCMYLKARLVDDMFATLLKELEQRGQLENTVIVAVTDHYAYGIKDTAMLMEVSGVDDTLLLDKTPCFIWSAGGPSVEVDKTLNTADVLPTVLNLMGVDSPYPYLGQDAFDDSYIGYALFSNGSWICDGLAYSAASGRDIVLQEGKMMTDEFKARMEQLVNQFIYVNNQILLTDYYDQ